MDGVLILRHITVENANAIAGLTWGFPAIANFLGFTHALQRRFGQKKPERTLQLLGCGIVCHSHQAQAYQGHEYADHMFALTRNPLGKTGQSSSFVEEGRMQMTVSLLIPFDGPVDSDDDGKTLAAELKQLALRLRLAGGNITAIKRVQIRMLSENEEQAALEQRKMLRSLLPGFALVSRQDALAEHQALRQQTPGTLAHYDCDDTDLQAWLEFASLSHHPQPPEDKEDKKGKEDKEDKVSWAWADRPYSGWLKPIAIGYKGISPLYQPGEVGNARDEQSPLRFVEMLYSLGEWLSPHRLTTIEQFIWRYHQVHDNYYCVNGYVPLTPSITPSVTTAAAVN